MLASTTAIFFITTVLFGLMALSPSTAPIRTEATRQAVQTSVERDVEEAASRFMTNLLNYSHETVAADVDRALQDATEDFAIRTHDVLEGGDIETFKETIVERRGVGSARVLAAAITSRDGGTATVLVLVSRTLDNDRLPQPEDQLLGVELTLVDTDEGWKVDAAAAPNTNN